MAARLGRSIVALYLLLAAPALAKPATIPASALLIRQQSPFDDRRWRIAPEAATQPALLKAMRSEALRQATKDAAAALRDAASARKAASRCAATKPSATGALPPVRRT